MTCPSVGRDDLESSVSRRRPSFMSVSGLSGGRDSICRISGALRPWRSSSAAAGAAAPSSRIRSPAVAVRIELVMNRLHHHGDTLAAPDAERREAEAAPSPSKLLQQGEAKPRPRGAYRVPQGDRAAIDVRFSPVQPQLPLHREVLRGKGFIYLDQVEILYPEAGPVQRLPRGRHQPYPHDIRIDPRHAPRNDTPQRRHPQGPGALERGHDDGRRSVIDAAGVAGGHHPVFLEDRGQGSQPQRAPRMMWGCWDMLSVPPARTTSASPSLISCAAITMACNPEPQRRLTVRAGTPMGQPALRPTWRAR